MYKLIELCKWNAAHLIDNGVKEYLYNQNAILEIIAKSLEDLDKLNGIRPYKKEEYLEMAKTHKELISIEAIILLFLKTYKNIYTDEGLSTSEKIHALKKSVELFEGLFDGISMQDAYLEDEIMSNAHAQILIDLKNKLQIEDMALVILSLLKESNNNFLLILDDNTKFYPVITDLLYDTFTLEYSFTQSKELINQLKSHKLYPFTKEAYIKENAFSLKFYAKIEFRKQVDIKKVRHYILYEFARALKCDIRVLKKLYKELLYFDTIAHPNALNSSIDISNIAPRHFIMSNIKMIKKVEYTGIKHAYSDISL